MKRHSLALLGLCAIVLSPITMVRPASAQTVSCTGIAAWATGVAYAVGAPVVYEGNEYKCLQAHTSEPGWDPVDAPALWTLVGACSTSTTSTTTGATCSATPSAPSGLSASGTTSTGTNLSWSAVTAPANCSITSYTIYKSGTSIGTSTSTSFSVTGLSAGTSYSFTVAATDSDGTGSQSSSISVTTSTASCSAVPSAPSGLAASNTTSSGTTLGWNAVTPPSNCSISSYTIYKSGTSIGTSTSTSFSVTGLSASTSYSFTVAATDSDGTGSQSSSVSVTTTSGGGGSTACYTAWSSTQVYTAGAEVSYSGENYTAAYWTEGNNPSTSSGTSTSGQPWIIDGPCNNGANCATIAPVPSGLAASGTTSTTTDLSWSAVTAPANCVITGYTVYENGSALATVSSGTTYVVTGLKASTAYKFTVASVDGEGTSGQSSSISITTGAQGSSASSKMIGYWESWGSTTLATVANNYDVVAVAFALETGTDGATITMPQMTESTNQVQADIATLHSQGKKVILSIGGASGYGYGLQNSADESAFVSSIESIFSQYAFDGIDLDIENNLLNLNSGDNNINAPTTPTTVYLIQGMEALASHYGSSFVYTMAPQTSDISAIGHWGVVSGIGWGDFIPLIQNTRNILTYCMTQDYNSGTEYGLNMDIYTEGTVDFNVAMSELLLHGYTVDNPSLQPFAALNQSQVVMGVPAVSAAAGSGYLAPSSVLSAIEYLMRGVPDGGSYTLEGGPYPNMGGVMTWDCNYDLNAGYPMAGELDSYLHSH